jgi:hypothetical protein
MEPKKTDEFDINRIQGGMSNDDIRAAAAAINRALRPAVANGPATGRAPFDMDKIGPGMSTEDSKSAVSSILGVLRADGFRG